MKFEIFTTHPQYFDDAFPHSNNFFCNEDDFDEEPDFPYATVDSHMSIFIVAIDGRKVAGGLQISYAEDGWMGDVDGFFWSMTGFGINEEYRGHGLSRKLVEKQFDFMRRVGIQSISQSNYTQSGLKYLYHIYEDFIKKNPDINYFHTQSKSFD